MNMTAPGWGGPGEPLKKSGGFQRKSGGLEGAVGTGKKIRTSVRGLYFADCSPLRTEETCLLLNFGWRPIHLD